LIFNPLCAFIESELYFVKHLPLWELRRNKGGPMKRDQGDYTGFNRDSLQHARALRKEMTRQERRLWYEFLRDYPVRFYRQRSIDRYIVDFYCPHGKLVVELDGGQHYEEEGREYDRRRTEVLQSYGLEVLRFSNLDVDREFAAVCEAIDAKVHKKL
jgi:very-short-patch-repair endonuclease